MATLQKIRTKAGLLVAIVIGISLAAFILGDMLQGGSSLFQKDKMEVGVIDGEKVKYPEFQREVEDLGEIFKQNYQTTQLDDNTWAQVRDQAWQTKIQNIVMGEVYDELGISVSSDELFDMLQGSNPHPIVQQIFRNPENGQFNKNAVIRFLKNLETNVAPEQRAYWLNVEKKIIEDRTQSKYTNMVAKGLYTTTNEAQSQVDASSKTVDFDYISLPYTSVSDDKITISQKELKAYYNTHQKDYEEEKSRKIEYITYPVNPSEEDYKHAKEWIEDIKADFIKTEDNVQFVNSNSDVDFENVWNKQDNLPENIGAWVFGEKPEVNSVFGPYEDGDIFTLAKLHKLEMMPDSVEARHILLAVKTQEEVLSAKNLADSLKTLIENGASFAKLARENSTDQGSAINGGDLGWFNRNQMVKPFEEAAFNNTTDSITIVMTQFGIHLIQTTKRGKLTPQAQVAYLSRKVTPSTKTYQDVYAKASKFAGENTTKEEFDAAVSEQGLTKRVAKFGENELQIAGLKSARPLIKAAFGTSVNNILKTSKESPIFEFGDNFVIATLVEATEKGTAPFETVKERIQLAVAKEKKGELLAEKAAIAINEATDLATIAAELSTEVKSVSNVSFNSLSIPEIGLEPALVGAVSSMPVDKISKPVEGNSGVFVATVTAENKGVEQNVAAEKLRLAQTKSYRIASEIFKAHKNSVKIEDSRSKFY